MSTSQVYILHQKISSVPNTYLSYFQEYKVYAIKKGPGKHKEKLKINQNNKRHYWNLKHKDESIALNLQYTG